MKKEIFYFPILLAFSISLFSCSNKSNNKIEDIDEESEVLVNNKVDSENSVTNNYDEGVINFEVKENNVEEVEEPEEPEEPNLKTEPDFEPNNQEEVIEDKYYSLNIRKNYSEATNYTINVEDINHILDGTEVTISNTYGQYKILQFLSLSNELLSSEPSYTFTIRENTSIKIIFGIDNTYFENSYYSTITSENTDIILLAGQSNMEGWDAPYSNLSQNVLDYYRSNHNNVRINYNCYYSSNFTNNSVSSGEFVNVDFGQGLNTTYFGPEVGIAKYLGLNNPNKKYLLVKVTYGGTNIAVHWNPDNISLTTDRYMFGRFVSCVDNALSSIGSKAISLPKIKAMCWFQGEFDANDNTRSSNYGTNFEKLTSSIKTRYSDYLSNDFKWISAGISNTYWQYNERINTVLREKSDSFIEETLTLDKINNQHYTALSYLTIGNLFGQRILN